MNFFRRLSLSAYVPQQAVVFFFVLCITEEFFCLSLSFRASVPCIIAGAPGDISVQFLVGNRGSAACPRLGDRRAGLFCYGADHLQESVSCSEGASGQNCACHAGLGRTWSLVLARFVVHAVPLIQQKLLTLRHLPPSFCSLIPTTTPGLSLFCANV